MLWKHSIRENKMDYATELLRAGLVALIQERENYQLSLVKGKVKNYGLAEQIVKKVTSIERALIILKAQDDKHK